MKKTIRYLKTIENYLAMRRWLVGGIGGETGGEASAAGFSQGRNGEKRSGVESRAETSSCFVCGWTRLRTGNTRYVLEGKF